MWRSSRSCAASGAPGARRGCCSRCWATSGSSSAIRTCRTTCSTIRSARRLLVEALRHRLHEIEKRRARTRERTAADRERDAKVAQLDRRGAAPRSTGSKRRSSRDGGAAQARACACCARHTRRDNVAFDGLARVSHVTDATDWRVEYPFVVLYPDTEDEVRGARRRAASSSGSRSSRAAAAPATPAARFRSTAARR